MQAHNIYLIATQLTMKQLEDWGGGGGIKLYIHKLNRACFFSFAPLGCKEKIKQKTQTNLTQGIKTKRINLYIYWLRERNEISVASLDIEKLYMQTFQYDRV